MAEVAIEKRFDVEVRDLEYQHAGGTPLLASAFETAPASAS